MIIKCIVCGRKMEKKKGGRYPVCHDESCIFKRRALYRKDFLSKPENKLKNKVWQQNHRRRQRKRYAELLKKNINIDDNNKVMRTCLSCDKQFLSVGIGNRICSDCNF